jgi:hypothetical protein
MRGPVLSDIGPQRTAGPVGMDDPTRSLSRCRLVRNQRYRPNGIHERYLGTANAELGLAKVILTP